MTAGVSADSNPTADSATQQTSPDDPSPDTITRDNMTSEDTITRDDIASKLHELSDSLSFLDTKESPISQNATKALAAIAGFVAVYFFGWRRGRRNKTVVEVRRI